MADTISYHGMIHENKGGSIMPLLSCSAMNCVYNEDSYCNKGDIQVDGTQAQEACETCCSSFKEKTGNCGCVKNSMGNHSGRTEVGCSAEHCQYNEHQSCMAGKVNISGASACDCSQTECSTFEKMR